MNDITLKLDSDGKGSFFIDQEGERLAEMVIRIADNNLTVYHTEVSDKLKGQGVATKLLSTMESNRNITTRCHCSLNTDSRRRTLLLLV